MDPLESGIRYNPKLHQEKEWDTSVQFLPASDSRALEKKKGLRKKGAAVGLVVLVVLIALMIGFVVWHFVFRNTTKITRTYTGTMKIINEEFQDYYEDPKSTEFQSMAEKVIQQLKNIYTRIPQLSKYYLGSKVQAFSEGSGQSVMAYYISEFFMSQDRVAIVDSSMASLGQTIDTHQGRMSRKQGSHSLRIDEVLNAAVDARMTRTPLKDRQSFSYHSRSGEVITLQSPGFPNTPYASNSYIEWLLRADPNHRLKLEFDTFSLENDCKKDFVRVYDSLVPIDKKILAEKCGIYPPNEPLSFISSGNVMLVTLVTNEEKNFPGFRASVSQIPQNPACGGTLTGLQGNFTSPNFPSYYPPLIQCVWDIQVPEGKFARVQFKKFLLAEPGQSNTNCQKDYVEINMIKLCGDRPSSPVVIVKSNKVQVVFNSDTTFVDRGFSAEFQAFEPTDPCPDKFLCKNDMCVNPALKCDGWNDCGDSSDEQNCECTAAQLKCKNGMCKPKLWLCDGVDDCGDSTDEQNCGGCKSTDFTCKNERCIPVQKKCDGKNDCGDGSDEAGCFRALAVTCSETSYMCKNNKCIDKVNPECDGDRDCEDGSDEAGCDCGQRPYKSSRIVGGQASMEGEWPWQVSLHIKGTGHVCGASIISDHWLVTAAHCVQDDPENKVLYSQAQYWEAYMGLHTQGKIAEQTVQKNIKRIIAHPLYNTVTYDNDIALMELDSSVSLNSNIWPICLPSPVHDFPVGSSVWITGWGATQEGGSGASILQKAEVRIINQTVCNQLMHSQITSRMLCAGVLTGGVDACQGDSGGPVSATGANGHMFLAGVVSWGDGCARRNKPGIYTRVTKFRSWIKQNTGV